MLFVPPSIPFMVPEAQATQLTMNSPNISEFDNFGNWAEPKVKYNPIGDFDYDSDDYDTCLAVQVLRPNGTVASITYDTACVQHQGYNFEGYINDAFNASGWTMKICAPDYNICVEQNFTISFAFLDADTTPPVLSLVCCALYWLTSGYEDDPNYSSDTTENITRQATNSTGYNVTYHVRGTDDVAMPNGYGDGTAETIDGIYWNSPQGSGNCSPAPGSLFPVGVTTITCSAADAAGNTGTGTFTVTVLAPAGTPTLTITAYLNGTSTTGRTISAEVSGWDDPAFANCQDDWCTMSVQVGIYKDGIKATFGDNVWHETLYTEGWPYANFAGHGSSTQIPIPADWEAGTYDIVWNNCGNYWQGFDSCSNADNKYTQGSTTVTIPALSGAEEEEIVIPSWIKSNAGWWDAGLIDDRNYVTGLQWLITNGVMTIG